jgi:hypothetical protein
MYVYCISHSLPNSKGVVVMEFNTTFNKISVISWRSVFFIGGHTAVVYKMYVLYLITMLTMVLQ